MTYRIVLVTQPSTEGEELCAALVAKGREVLALDPSNVELRRPGVHEIIVVSALDGVEKCEALLRRSPRCAVIVLDREASIERAVTALRAGAADFVPGPLDADAVDAAIQRVIDKRMPPGRESRFRALSLAAEAGQQDLVGDSIVMRQVRQRIDRLKGSDATVLITGERGTGRSVVAKVLHDQSSRKSHPFVSVDCSALPSDPERFFTRPSNGAADASDGTWVRAAGGTLFLNEVERLPAGIQAKLCRTLERRGLRSFVEDSESGADPRLIAASNVDLADEVAAGHLREELVDRLSVVEIRLPPLRDRGLDTLLLAQHFVRRYAGATGRQVAGMTLGAARMLLAHDWPGNVSELGAWIEAAVAVTHHDHITESELLSNWTEVLGARERSSNDDTLMSWNSLEARHIASILEEAGGNKARAARLLGIDRKTLHRKLERYGLEASDRHRRAH